ncbi:FkbM family methyltransferase [Treponema sp. UBA3813]|uniref:FkbM family methyltransferase n=1 Tax=Treponema sp. UBA3813 TaxID=1947715 RepID=UPI0025FA7370|nr:FkbM family methyltransferase [Treponema sp. UBA3813]
MKQFTRADIEKFLKQNISNLKNKTLYIMGGGNTTQLFQEGLSREFFYNQIKGYTNSNSVNWGKEMFGKPCVGPESLAGQEDVLVLINTPQPAFIKEMRKKLSELNIESCLMEEAILKNHAKEVLEVYDMLFDQKSKDVYANMLWCRLKGEYPDCDLLTKDQYFCWNEFTNKNIGSVFVDCGAYVGDSMERYIWNKDGVVDKIMCFEPDKNNYKAMQFRTERLKKEWNLSDNKITLLPYGVSDISMEGVVQEYSANNGLGSKIIQGSSAEGTSIKIVALDDVISERIDYLKADIESYEYKMLLGAEKTIKKYQPCVAVCIYHNSTDFYSIPLLLKRMMPEARMAVRHHSNTLADTVLYAWT